MGVFPNLNGGIFETVPSVGYGRWNLSIRMHSFHAYQVGDDSEKRTLRKQIGYTLQRSPKFLNDKIVSV